MSQAQAIIDSLRTLRAVAVAEIDLSGKLVDANAGFLRLIHPGGQADSEILVAPSMISPTFARLIELSAAGVEPLYEGLMTLGDPLGKSQSLRGSVSRTIHGLLLLLEYDVEELGHVAEVAIELSSELARAQRRLLTVHAQLKVQEAQRAESEQRLIQETIRRRILVEQSRDGIVVLNEDGHVFEANQRFGEMLGYTPEEVSQLHVWDWDANWTRTELLQLLHDSDETGNHFETRHRRKNGTLLDVEISGNGAFCNGRKLIFCVCRDISQRKQAENEIRNLNAGLEQRVAERTSELESLNQALMEEALARTKVEVQMRRLVDVIEASPDLVGMADSQGKILYLNRSFITALGRSPEREPLEIKDCQPSSTLQLLQKEGLPTAARSGVWRGETELLTTQGELIPVSQIILAHHDAQGRLEFFSTIMRDMSERQRMDAALRHRSEELVAANAELARAARLKDEFLASMSHELRTPLNGILAMSESLQEQVYGTLNTGQTRAIRDIEECGRHLLALINDVLDVARIEAGKIELDIQPVLVSSLCQSSLRMVKSHALKKRIDIAFEVDESVKFLDADEVRLKQVLVNLLSNAVKFTPEAGRIGLQVVGDRLNHQVFFTVWDTGIGVSADDQRKLFKPFVQLDSGLARKYEGTGLGLALVKRLTEMHGGSVKLLSQPGQGSRFIVSLPWCKVAEVPGPGECNLDSEPGPGGCSPELPGAPLILVVADEAMSGRSLQDYLEFKGYRVKQTSPGSGADELAVNIRPDLILVDLQAPYLAALETVREMHRLSPLSRIPYVILSVQPNDNDQSSQSEDGLIFRLSKPVMFDELRQVIARLLRQPVKASDVLEVEIR